MARLIQQLVLPLRVCGSTLQQFHLFWYQFLYLLLGFCICYMVIAKGKVRLVMGQHSFLEVAPS